MKKLMLSLVAAVTMLTATTVVSASAEEVIVQKGDTLWGIAQEKGVSVHDIKEMNNLHSNRIYPAQRLAVRVEEEVTLEAYTIKAGDSLWDIGQQFGVSVHALKQWNHLTSDLIYAGDKLIVNGESIPVEPASQTSAKAKQPATKQTATAEPKQSTTQQEEQKVTASASKEQTETAEAKEATSAPKQTADQQSGNTIAMQATAYTANCSGCSGVTATGIDLHANPNQKVVAVDPNVIPLGTKVHVEGYGTAIAGDTGGAINGNKIDLYMQSKQDALQFGRQTVQVTIIE
ncbi:3D domain-containing protein [Pontibacillus litoralis]|uniref:Peptidoglycan-binding protein n=1 Tax=Pontibacillus litoralis JSM 072002 TaxID=1385512 RepID=A0A0A5HTW4_9BACI|nr:3D domain-containing protein [Pontibacillus litoralis]KGX87047.1 peptidoglycan-binding protein [Pontibacillus litoralis JSM 072002]